MPPKPKVSKQDIVEAAVRLVRNEGLEAFNARSVARELGCSTQPIFSAFESMNDLRDEVLREAGEFFELFIAQHTQPERVLISISMAYISFARQEPHFFKLLFLSDEIRGTTFFALSESNPAIIQNIVDTAGIGAEEARDLFLHVWIFVHGLATLLVSGEPLEAEYLDTLVQDAVIGFYRLYS